MSMLKAAALAVAALGGLAALAPAKAEPWRHQGYYGQGHHRHAAPQPYWAPPKVLRKQAELRERFVEKYGYVQPHRGWGHPGRHHRPHGAWDHGWR